MNKMIKLSEEHYIIVDDSEIEENNWCYATLTKQCFQCNKIDDSTGEVYYMNFGVLCPKRNAKKITHSTQPLNKEFSDWFDVQIITLSEVKELVKGYSVENMAEKWLSLNYGDVLCGYAMMDGYIEGFKAHEELTKDKLFTVEEITKPFSKAFTKFINEGGANGSSEEQIQWQNVVDWFPKYIQSLLPKTEWEVEFDDEGKIKLI